DTLDRSSETVFFTFPVCNKDCFHAAGSITFYGQGNLFLATGDNTSPFASDGFAPIDEQPGRKAFDAQRSSANTNDLRGKILRIKPMPDGSYICPKGNLFVKEDVVIAPQQFGMEYRTPNIEHRISNTKQRPEIYVMGCRNPFRISYDARREMLFWGDIGPDAGKNNAERGPQGHDEINRTKTAGFFGWPYFVADNQAYRDYDYATKTSGPAFNHDHPQNNSPNNTGLNDLPPAQPAFIWYPYGKNRDFPIAGSGGRNAMAGPVYYADAYPKTSRFPDYYNGKLIIYDWMRGWLMAVTMDSLGNFNHMEPFADSVRLSRPMDMFFSKSGTLWLIEYGARWYSSNEDARLSRIDYVQGNRPPIARLKADQTATAAPSTITFDTDLSNDYDGGPLHFDLDFGNGEHLSFNQPDTHREKEPILQNNKPVKTKTDFSHPTTYAVPGSYKALLTVTDAQGATASATVHLEIGNEQPSVQWNLAGSNRSFYRDGDTLHYQLEVNDREDGFLNQGISATDVSTSFDFMENGVNPSTLGKPAPQTVSAERFIYGKQLIDQSDCKSCHAIDKQVNG
ncbi:MAG: PQQ-dependent sugar dehydrogenase, partial [Saprospiraceae bacterium]|nr:PQQ-dependent sugar dehydrogenase [Saprospiraceae bacterium]